MNRTPWPFALPHYTTGRDRFRPAAAALFVILSSAAGAASADSAASLPVDSGPSSASGLPQRVTESGLPIIEWDASTLQLVACGGSYGRMARLVDGRIACVYDRDRRMWVQFSKDEGKSWAAPIEVAVEEGCALTNADLLVLRSGRLLYFWNERPLAALSRGERSPPPGAPARPFRICMSHSDDQGASWSVSSVLHEAGVKFEDGCWEPAAIELPSGEIQLYFADESPFRSTAEQQISELRSLDGGITWSPAQRVAFRAQHRDGMPSPLLLVNGRTIVIAIEDNGLAGGRFKPVILSADANDGWRSGFVGADSPRRWSALADPLPQKWYGGAPSLRRMPDGTTLLSFQESESGELAGCRMAVCVGDRNARGFTNKTYPFGRPSEGMQAWNALFVKDTQTLTALSSTTIDGVRGVWAIDGRIRTASNVRKHEVSPRPGRVESALSPTSGDNSGLTGP